MLRFDLVPFQDLSAALEALSFLETFLAPSRCEEENQALATVSIKPGISAQ
jgi:hypothetical protein